MAYKRKKKPGRKRKVGRPSTGIKCVTMNISLKDQEQKEYLKLFGGSKFVQESIEKEYQRRITPID